MDKVDKKQQTNAERRYPGASSGDKCNRKVSETRVNRDTKSLNNNPRNNEIDE